MVNNENKNYKKMCLNTVSDTKRVEVTNSNEANITLNTMH